MPEGIRCVNEFQPNHLATWHGKPKLAGSDRH